MGDLPNKSLFLLQSTLSFLSAPKSKQMDPPTTPPSTEGRLADKQWVLRRQSGRASEHEDLLGPARLRSCTYPVKLPFQSVNSQCKSSVCEHDFLFFYLSRTVNRSNCSDLSVPRDIGIERGPCKWLSVVWEYYYFEENQDERAKKITLIFWGTRCS